MLELIKKIREKTGAGVVEIKKALDESGGNEEKAIDIIRTKSGSKALKKSDRETKEGIVVSYIHSNNKVGSLVKIYCETDFVSRNEEFRELGKDIAMHITAMSPQFIKPEDVGEELIEKEKVLWTKQAEIEKKPKELVGKIMDGKEKKFREEISLLSQSFVKDPEKTVGELIAEKISKMGENIKVGDFTRFDL